MSSLQDSLRHLAGSTSRDNKPSGNEHRKGFSTQDFRNLKILCKLLQKNLVDFPDVATYTEHSESFKPKTFKTLIFKNKFVT